MDDIKKQIEAITAKIAGSEPIADDYFCRGKLYWRLGDRASAITDFNEALTLDPDSPAKAYLRMANEILDFYNTDLYNP